MFCITDLLVNKNEKAIYSQPYSTYFNTILPDNALNFTVSVINDTLGKSKRWQEWFSLDLYTKSIVLNSSYLVAEMCVCSIWYCSPQLLASKDPTNLHWVLRNILTSLLSACDGIDASVKKPYSVTKAVYSLRSASLLQS